MREEAAKELAEPKAGEAAVDERGEPVPVVEGGDLEEQEVPENTAATM